LKSKTAFVFSMGWVQRPWPLLLPRRGIKILTQSADGSLHWQVSNLRGLQSVPLSAVLYLQHACIFTSSTQSERRGQFCYGVPREKQEITANRLRWCFRRQVSHRRGAVEATHFQRVLVI